MDQEILVECEQNEIAKKLLMQIPSLSSEVKLQKCRKCIRETTVILHLEQVQNLMLRFFYGTCN
jgi:hypothetical protein